MIGRFACLVAGAALLSAPAAAAGESGGDIKPCERIDPRDVQVTRQGFYVRPLDQTVPYSAVTRGPAGLEDYWRCPWTEGQFLFIAPQGVGYPEDN